METSDLERRLRDAFSDADRRLLESAKGDAAGPGARDEMLAVLGVAGVAVPERFVVRLGRYLRSSGGSLLSGVFVALFIGAATSAVVVWRSSESPPAPAVSPAVSSEVPPIAVRAPSPIEGSAQAAADRASAPVITLDSLPSAPAIASAAPVKVNGKASVVSGTPPPTDTLGREIARVEAARSALSRDEVTRALALLDAYEREFSPGAFAVEVSVLRIEALARAGKTEQARRLGTRFLADHPRDAFARRVASTLDALPSLRSPDE